MATDPRALPAAESLWRFSLALYGRPDVASACLEIQDRRGADVCLLLYAAWAGAVCGRRLTPEEADRLRRSVAAWREDVVLPLRSVRRRLKSGPPPAPDAATAALRGRIQEAEIEAERIELSHLSAMLPLAPAPDRPDTPSALARANLDTVCPPQDPADAAALARIAEGCE